MPSKFVELIDNPRRMSSFDVRLEDVLAHQEALISPRSRSSTFSSSKVSLVEREQRGVPRDMSTSSLTSSTSSSSPTSSSPTAAQAPAAGWKRLSNILAPKRSS